METNNGFTLLEILLVVAAIAILAGIALIAINPAYQLASTRNAQRHSDVETIANAVYQYYIDTGALPTSILTAGTATNSTEVCVTTTPNCTNGTVSLTDLGGLIANQKFLAAIPVDPSGADDGGKGTGYSIIKTVTNRITVTSNNAENGITISLTK